MPTDFRLDHPVMGPLAWDPGEGAWLGVVRLAPFAEYRGEAIEEGARADLRRIYRESGGEWVEPAVAAPSAPTAAFPLAAEPPTSGVTGWQAVKEWWRNRGQPPAEPAAAQVRAFEILIGSPNEIEAAIMAVTFDLYRTESPSWRNDGITSTEAATVLFPQLDDAEGLKRLLRLTGVRILGYERDGLAFAQLRFECSWDDEHGYEVYVHGKRALLDLPAS